MLSCETTNQGELWTRRSPLYLLVADLSAHPSPHRLVKDPRLRRFNDL